MRTGGFPIQSESFISLPSETVSLDNRSLGEVNVRRCARRRVRVSGLPVSKSKLLVLEFMQHLPETLRSSTGQGDLLTASVPSLWWSAANVYVVLVNPPSFRTRCSSHLYDLSAVPTLRVARRGARGYAPNTLFRGSRLKKFGEVMAQKQLHGPESKICHPSPPIVRNLALVKPDPPYGLEPVRGLSRATRLK